MQFLMIMLFSGSQDKCMTYEKIKRKLKVIDIAVRHVLHRTSMVL